MNINFLSASELSVKIASGEISSRSVVEAFIEQVRSQNPTWNAIVFLNEREALRQADQADKDLAAGKSHGLLHGVPITVKDTYSVKGIPVTSGYTPLKNFIPGEDAVIVRRLKDEGAIILGKTNTAVLAMDMQTDNPVFGRTNNPWDITRTPAGSSGGCAAALATGMTPLSFGSDLAGSIRVPAAFCGVYGFKPTHGVLSMKGHIPPLPGEINGSRMLAVPGPLGRSVEDIILAMTILSKPNPYDRFVAPWRLIHRGCRVSKTLKLPGATILAMCRSAGKLNTS
jgi:amidase